MGHENQAMMIITVPEKSPNGDEKSNMHMSDPGTMVLTSQKKG
jgi:hypothetical protein